MCGIIGTAGEPIDSQHFSERVQSLRHRGPDGTGYFSSQDGSLRLAHHRLAVIDLSDRAKQPMTIEGCTLVYNGEIYNYLELKREIGGEFSSSSDTEVILRGYLHWGAAVFAKLDGMFALAIYDSRSGELILARDRMGIKPLYYIQKGNELQFASEIQGLETERQINPDAIRSYLFQNYVYAEEEILCGVRSFPAGCYGLFRLQQGNWLVQSYLAVPALPQALSGVEGLDMGRQVLRDSVRRSLLSDVPLGVFLSSGVDSSLIAALAQEVAGGVNTFTVSFDSASFDESARAGEIAQILGTNHHRIELDKREVLAQIPQILDHFHMPFGDSSALPFYFLSLYARERVKVALSGDGADELFGGYPLYYLPPIARLYRLLPGSSLVEWLVSKLPASFQKMSFDEKARRFTLAARHDYRAAHFWYRAMHNSLALRPEYQLDPRPLLSLFASLSGLSVPEQLMRVDQHTVLERDYLVKADRMSMAHGLEVRLPFLNNRVVDFAASLPAELKVRRFTTKVLLKKILEDYLPKRLIYTKKQGFSFPVAEWLCGELKELMFATLSRKQVAQVPYLDYSGVQGMIQDHLERRRDYSRELWGLISLVRYLSRQDAEA